MNFHFQPSCVNTTEMDIKKACRTKKPIKASKHSQLGVDGGRISPTHTETPNNRSPESIKKEIDILKQRLDKRNIKISKVAET